jgi:hypothetical protein
MRLRVHVHDNLWGNMLLCKVRVLSLLSLLSYQWSLNCHSECDEMVNLVSSKAMMNQGSIQLQHTPP